jgi:hypothetical protein
MIRLSDIAVSPDRLRKLRPEKVDELVESMGAPQGLLHPILVRPHDGRYELVIGQHRLAAAKELEWETIRAEIRELDDDAAQLAEIDENLARAELSPAERALHFGERKRLYEKIHPQTRHGAVGRRGKSSQNENSFVADAAAKTGKGRSTVARDVTRANKIVVLPEIIGTSLDQGDELDALAKLPEVEQRRLAGQAQAGENVSAIRRGITTGVAMNPYAERGLDLYETPEAATRTLLAVESFLGPVWEPAAGRGAIVRVLRKAGHKVIAADIKDNAYCCPDAIGGVDFLKEQHAPAGVETIITNPPFMRADEFVRHALNLVPRVVMLLRVLFIAGVGRSDILEGGRLARVHVFRERIETRRDGWEGPHGSSPMSLAWFVWEREHEGPPEIHRISPLDDFAQSLPSPSAAEAPTAVANGSAAIEPPIITVSVPFMITAPMKGQLRGLGYSDADIFTMTPAKAVEILRAERPRQENPFGGDAR